MMIIGVADADSAARDMAAGELFSLYTAAEHVLRPRSSRQKSAGHRFDALFISRHYRKSTETHSRP